MWLPDFVRERLDWRRFSSACFLVDFLRFSADWVEKERDDDDDDADDEVDDDRLLFLLAVVGCSDTFGGFAFASRKCSLNAFIDGPTDGRFNVMSLL